MVVNKSKIKLLSTFLAFTSCATAAHTNLKQSHPNPYYAPNLANALRVFHNDQNNVKTVTRVRLRTGKKYAWGRAYEQACILRFKKK